MLVLRLNSAMAYRFTNNKEKEKEQKKSLTKNEKKSKFSTIQFQKIQKNYI